MSAPLETNDLETVVSSETDVGALELRTTVPARASSVTLVRNAVRGFAEGWRTESVAPESFTDERAADLALIFTELVTNAVVHSGASQDDTVEVRLALSADGIDGSVTDPGPGFSTAPGALQPRVDGGFGLFIVGRLVRRWGVRRVDGRNEVWFEF